MFRIKIPVLDIYGSKDWEITQVGGYERRGQIQRVPGSGQVVLQGAPHVFEDKEGELVNVIVNFLENRLRSSPTKVQR